MALYFVIAVMAKALTFVAALRVLVFRNPRSAKANASGTHLAVLPAPSLWLAFTKVFNCHFFGLLFPTALL